MEFPNVEWTTESGHPASGIRYQVAEVNAWPGDPHFVPGQFARVVQVRNGNVLVAPMRNTTEVYRRYNRYVQAALEYELAKIDTSENMRVVFIDNEGDTTRPIMVTPETMVKIAAILRDAPENQW